MKNYISASAFWPRQLLGIILLSGVIVFPFFDESELAVSFFVVLCFLMVMCFSLPRSNLLFSLSLGCVPNRNIQTFVKGSAYVPFLGIMWYFFSSELLKQVEERKKKIELQESFEDLQEKFLNPNPYKLGDLDKRTDPLAYAREMLSTKLIDAAGVVHLVFYAEDVWRSKFFEVLEKFSTHYSVMVRRHAMGPMFVLPTQPEPKTATQKALSTPPGIPLGDVPPELMEAYLVLGYFNRAAKLLVQWDQTEKMLLKCLYDAQVSEEKERLLS